MGTGPTDEIAFVLADRLKSVPPSRALQYYPNAFSIGVYLIPTA
jgi:hypothetical protein